MHKHIVLPDVKASIGTNQIFTTLASQFQSHQQVLLQNIVLPKFKYTAYIDNHTCQIFIGPCYYNIILGQDFLQKIQFFTNSDNNTMNCMDMSVPMQSPDHFSDQTQLHDLKFIVGVEFDSFASTITKSTYQPISISTIVDTQTQLTVEYRNKLSIMLSKHTMLFDGIPKVYPHQLVHLDIIPNATPWH